MKSLRAGEIIREIFTINCKFGKSTLYISNIGIMIENFNGAILELDHSSILSLQPFDKKIIKVVWIENKNPYSFVFSTENAAELTAKYRTVHEDYHNLMKTIGIKFESKHNTLQSESMLNYNLKRYDQS